MRSLTLILPVFSILSLLAISGCQREYATPRHPLPAYAPALPPAAPTPYSVAVPSPPPAVAVAPEAPSPPPSIAAGSTAPPATPAAPAVSGGATRPAAARLLQLKELLDRKLITPEEYEERRRQIIDAL